jgi:hypothetical protein
MKPQMTFVKSSQIKAIGYDTETNELYVDFNNGTTYKYLNVELEVFETMCKAESVGKYLGSFIKNVYEYIKLL